MVKHVEKFELNGTTHLLTFGLGFLEALNRKYTIEQEGLSLGAGVIRTMGELNMHNPLIIKDMVLFGTLTNYHKVDEAELDEWILDQMDGGELENALFDRFFDMWKTIPGAKRYIEAQENNTAAEKETKKKTK